MVLLKINKDRSRLTFAGANNPLYLLRDGEIREYKGDKMPVAIHVRMQDFGLHELDIKAGDAIISNRDKVHPSFEKAEKNITYSQKSS